MDIEQQINVLKSVENNPTASQREHAENSGMSLGKVNFCLNALIDKGLIKVDNFRNNTNKIKYMYLLTPKGISEKSNLTKEFLQLKMREYDKLKSEIASLEQELRD